MNQNPFSQLPDEAFIRLKTLLAWGLVPFSASTLWRKAREGTFPSPEKISPNCTAWRVGTIKRWLADPIHFDEAKDKTAGERQ